MKKEIIKREKPQNHVLYEEAEPLFPPFHGVKGHILRAAACGVAALAVCAVCVFAVIAISGAAAGGSADTEEKTASHNTEQTTESPLFWGQPDVTETDLTDEQTDSETEWSDRESTEGHLSDTGETEVSAVDIVTEHEGKYVINYTSKTVDVQGLVERGFVYSEKPYSIAPLVMIIHTHTSEEYARQGGGNPALPNSVVAVGDKINAELNALGLSSVHCTVIHDGTEQNAYLAARETIKMMLKIYPSIKYVIDVHRMSLGDEDGRPLATVLTEKGGAQVRLTVATDVKREGEWQDDLSLALTVMQELNGEQRRACAPVALSHGGYNGDLCRFFLMLEVGAQGNTLKQAMSAGQSFAKAFAQVVLDR